MGLSLGIIAHELEAIGRVVRAFDGNPSFEGARCYLPGKPPVPSMLYVCASADDVRDACEAGCSAVYASPDEEAQPASAAMLTVSGAPAMEVLDALLDVFARYGAWERAMDALFHEGGTLQDLLDASEPFLKNNVVVLDPALKLLAYTRSVPCDDPVTCELIEHGYHTEENIRKFKLHRRFKPWSESKGFVINDTHAICKYTTVVKSFKARTSFSLIAVMMCNVEEPQPYLLDTFNMVLDRVGRYALRDYPDDKPSGNMVDTFLKDLVSGAIEGEEAVVERSQYVGIPAEGRFCLFYLKAEGDSVPSSRLLADVSLVVAPAKTAVIGDAMVVLCFNCRSDTCALHCVAGRCPHNRHTVSQRLDEMMRRYDMTCGRSSMFERLGQVPIAYDQAREAYAISRGERPVREGEVARNMWDRIFSFDAYALEYLANQVPERSFALLGQTYAGRILSELAAQDVATKMNNYEFLRAYLVYERRVTVVAEQLHMHRNNVGYRINRIEEQFGIDTDDPALRQDLLAAYRLRDAFLRSA